MHSPFFSIVIPTLDEEKTLPLLLKDISVQTFDSFEVIVVDGGSKDKTIAIAQQFTGFLNQTIRSKTAKNVSAQRNEGAALSKGSHLLFLDADTRIPRYYLEGIHYQLMKNEADAWTTFASPDAKGTEEKLFVRLQNFAFEGGSLLGIPYAVGAALGIKKSVFDELHGFDTSIQFMEDVELIRRLYKSHYNFSVYKDPLFELNMRRYKKEGTLTLMMKLIPAFTQSLISDKVSDISDIYPMNGGAYYKKKRQTTVLQLREIQRVIRRIMKSRTKKAEQFLQQAKELIQSL